MSGRGRVRKGWPPRPDGEARRDTFNDGVPLAWRLRFMEETTGITTNAAGMSIGEESALNHHRWPGTASTDRTETTL